jgi:uncharacterized protein YvpB
MRKFVTSTIIFLVLLLNTHPIDPYKWVIRVINKFYESPALNEKKMALATIQPILPERKSLDVPLINQLDEPHLKNGCEVTSLAMILNYAGIKVTKNTLANEVRKVPIKDANNTKGNPNYGFVGDMANGPGYFVYNGPIFELAQKYARKKAVNLTNSPFEDLLKKVNMGYPVWVISTLNFSSNVAFQKWDTVQGPIYITTSEHSAVITGFDNNYIYVNDPYGYKNRKVDRKTFINAWEEMGSQAIIIEK